MKRCALYARVSTAKQAEQNISIPDQLRRMREYAAARGIDLVAEYEERGVSGREEKRPEFQRMIEAACVKPKPFDVILVHSLSRFFRDEINSEL